MTREGQRVEIVEELDYFPDFIVPAGSRGIVKRVDYRYTWVLLERAASYEKMGG